MYTNKFGIQDESTGENGGKKKSKRVTGIGGTNNLKKNKLAIAFNNLEVEQNDKD